MIEKLNWKQQNDSDTSAGRTTLLRAWGDMVLQCPDKDIQVRTCFNFCKYILKIWFMVCYFHIIHVRKQAPSIKYSRWLLQLYKTVCFVEAGLILTSQFYMLKWRAIFKLVNETNCFIANRNIERVMWLFIPFGSWKKCKQSVTSL